MTVDPYVGGRFTYINVDLDARGSGTLQIPASDGSDVGVPFQFARSAGDSVSWVEPIIGFRTIWDIDAHWNIITNANIGGFGAGSDFAWQAGAFGGYRFGLFSERDSNFIFGYQVLDQRYRDSSRNFEWDVTASGPVLGLAISF